MVSLSNDGERVLKKLTTFSWGTRWAKRDGALYPIYQTQSSSSWKLGNEASIMFLLGLTSRYVMAVGSLNDIHYLGKKIQCTRNKMQKAPPRASIEARGGRKPQLSKGFTPPVVRTRGLCRRVEVLWVGIWGGDCLPTAPPLYTTEPLDCKW